MADHPGEHRHEGLHQDPDDGPPRDLRRDPRALSLEREDTLLLVIDVQERLALAMEPAALSAMTAALGLLLRAAARLGLPIVATEQDRAALGPTLPLVAALLPAPPLPKLEYSAGNNREIARAVLQSGRRQVLLAGFEAHVCVFQTARDLVRGGLAAFVVEDAVLSRRERDQKLGLRLCERAGATVTGVEAAIYDLLGRAGTEEHRDLAQLLER